MRTPKASLSALLILAGLGLAACGNDNDPRLTNADVDYIKMQRYQQLYGGGTQTATMTQTQTSTVTMTQICAMPANNIATCVQGRHGVWDPVGCRWNCQ